ncbi:MAG TPA: dihydrofolate reductase family protein [Flavisolibacter sp.]
MTVNSTKRKIIVNLATSVDGFIARPDDDIEWLIRRPEPEGFYGMNEFMKSVDVYLLGRKTYEVSLTLGEKFEANAQYYVFSRQPAPSSVPPKVKFIDGDIVELVQRLQNEKGKDIWLMGGGELIASFLDQGLIDEFIISVVPVFIGEGIPLIAPRHRDIELTLMSVTQFPDGLVQVHYAVNK